MTTTDKPYSLLIAKEIMVPMRDGVRLATDLYRPAHVPLVVHAYRFRSCRKAPSSLGWR